MTFSVAIFATPSTPHRTFGMQGIVVWIAVAVAGALATGASRSAKRAKLTKIAKTLLASVAVFAMLSWQRIG